MTILWCKAWGRNEIGGAGQRKAIPKGMIERYTINSAWRVSQKELEKAALRINTENSCKLQ